MGGNYSGRDTHIGFGKETTFGTAVTISRWLKQTGFSGGYKPSYTEDNSRVGSRAKSGSFKTGALGDLTIPINVHPEEIGSILKGIFGLESVVAGGGSGSYVHTFRMGDTIPSWTVERKYSDVVTKLAVGGVMNTLSFEVAKDAIMSASLGMNFKSESDASAGTPSFASVMPFVFSHGSLTLDGAAFGEAQGFKLDISNNVKTDDKRIGGGGEVASFDPQGFDASGSLNVVLNTDSLDLVDAVQGDTAMALVLTMDTGIEIASSGDNYQMIITIPNLKFTAADMGTEEDGMMIDVPFTCFDDATDGPVKIELYCNDSAEY